MAPEIVYQRVLHLMRPIQNLTVDATMEVDSGRVVHVAKYRRSQSGSVPGGNRFPYLQTCPVDEPVEFDGAPQELAPLDLFQHRLKVHKDNVCRSPHHFEIEMEVGVDVIRLWQYSILPVQRPRQHVSEDFA
jgi:hypothetical protein